MLPKRKMYNKRYKNFGGFFRPFVACGAKKKFRIFGESWNFRKKIEIHRLFGDFLFIQNFFLRAHNE